MESKKNKLLFSLRARVPVCSAYSFRQVRTVRARPEIAHPWSIMRSSTSRPVLWRNSTGRARRVMQVFETPSGGYIYEPVAPAPGEELKKVPTPEEAGVLALDARERRRDPEKDRSSSEETSAKRLLPCLKEKKCTSHSWRKRASGSSSAREEPGATHCYTASSGRNGKAPTARAM